VLDECVAMMKYILTGENRRKSSEKHPVAANVNAN
jgi:hypothetical protein